MLVHCLIILASIMSTGDFCNSGEMKQEILAATHEHVVSHVAGPCFWPACPV
jgi:hypothetical protein